MNLTPEDRAALAREIGTEVFALQVSPVLTTDQAMRVVGKKSHHALYMWTRKYAPRAACGNGRYSRAKIIQGLNKEESTGNKSKSGAHLKKPTKTTSRK